MAATGSGADATAEITATPAAPASRTSAAFPASIPPMPTTGNSGSTTARRPSSPRASASGFVGVDHRSRRGSRRPPVPPRGLLRVADAHPEHAFRPQPAPGGPRVVVLTDVRARGSAPSATSTPIVHDEQHARVATASASSTAIANSSASSSSGGTELDRRRPAFDRRVSDRAMIAAGTERPGRHDVDTERAWIDRSDSLRRYYPVQVIRVAGGVEPASQPGIPELPGGT